MDSENTTRIKQASKPGWIGLVTDMRATLGRVVVALESVFFFVVFTFFAVAMTMYFFRPLEEPVLGMATPLGVLGLLPDLFRNPGGIAPDTTALHAFALFGTTVIRPLLLVFFSALCAAFIAIRTGIQYRPTSLREVAIPFAGTFTTMLLPLSAQVGWFGEPFALPDGYVVPLLALGTLLGVGGGALTVYALTHLRRNFSIFVEVRNVVLTGPYRYVRHPMYLGEIALTVGLVLSMLSPFSISVLACFIYLQYLRGRMEQTRLSEASAEYADSMRSSGMFLPKI